MVEWNETERYSVKFKKNEKQNLSTKDYLVLRDEDDIDNTCNSLSENVEILKHESNRSMQSNYNILDDKDVVLISSESLKEEDKDGVYDIKQKNGYNFSYFRSSFYILISLLSLGLIPLVCRWIPQLKIFLTHYPVKLNKAHKIIIESIDGKVTVCPVIQLGGQRAYNYRNAYFVLDPSDNTFKKIGFRTNISYSRIYERMRNGVSSQVHWQRMQNFGPNLIDVKVKSIPSLLIDEVLHPFYIFQIASIIIWCMDDYYYYAACIFIVATVSAFFSLTETRRNLKNLRDMAMYICQVNVFRNSKFQETSSETLVPGDVVEIPSNFVLPCDMILLSGQSIVNESMLTGESIPIVKTPLPVSDDDIYHADKDKKNTLYAGTKVIQTRAYGDEKVLGLVSRTSFSTAKGSLMLSILYPKPNQFKFYSDSFKFIGVLFLIALCGFTFSLVGFIQMGVDWFHIMVRALDIITVVVPPALPVAMTAGTVFAIQRLKKNRIYCISPPRVNVSGKLKLMCFDKTGTLTEEGLDFLGIRPIRNTNFELNSSLDNNNNNNNNDEQSIKFMDLVEDLHHVKDTPISNALASCHNLTYVDNELVGDPLDIKIFNATHWQLEEPQGIPSEVAIPTIVHPPGEQRQFYLTDLPKEHMPFELGIIRRFDFNSHLQRMSVIAKDLKHDKVYAFTKGSPEMIKQLSDPETIPQNFSETLFGYAHQGYRVLACAYRELSGTPWLKIQRMRRGQVEQRLRFLGLIVMQNKVKPETKPSLQTLSQCNIRSVMVTGDNPFTALSVARECHLVNPSRNVFLGDVENGRVTWTDIDSSRQLNPETLMPYIHNENNHNGNKPDDVDNDNDNDNDVGEFELAVTGKAFEQLVRDHDHERTPDPLFRKILVGAQIFSRMSPDQKTRLVEELQNIGYFVGMCGDGANDCGALKASHVGISLSEAEASIAAPFTSHNADISSVEKVMREGRAALATSFSLFKYMALYSMIQFISVIILYRINSNLGNWQFLWIDMFVILPVAVLMGRTEARQKLVKKRPPGSLISIPVMTSLFGQILISLLFQIIVVIDVKSQPWFQPLDPDPHKDNILCHLNTVVFLVSNFQYISVALAFSISKPFRRSVITNKLYTLCLLILTACALYMIFIPDQYTRDIMQLDMEVMDVWYRLRIFGYVIINLIASWLYERIFVMGPGQRLCNNEWWKRKKRKKKLYRTLRSDFERSWSHMSLSSSDLP